MTVGRWLRAIRGAVGFLTRLPVGHHDGDWEAFRTTPAAFPVVGLVAGSLAAVPLLAVETLAAPTVALGYLLAVYGVMGVHHVDGVADLGDALVVHGDRERRREVLKDTTTGVGAVLAVSVTVAALALGALGLAGLPALAAVGIAVAAEVGTKLGMAAMACLGTASYEGMGRQFTERSTPRAFVPLAVVVLAAMGLTWPRPAAVALPGAVAGIVLPWYWSNRHLGGINGDIFGAANEIGRVAGIHVGVIAWTLL
ncbi:adenosylcobinamide-GDP ribazoletransferase [Natronobacterium gregoryi]|uniref:Adenosylcobinamide-GDP ribazoletransferase n=2 Tax=Natronobacterium gregoryi TaxID=44930 RepID=L0AL35_NATGS|nr:adenosylcobinamide-GDP ribazoletransferase [Natronobacterium gregoryi]AFZ73907.1 cobalamin 5''-phosphate synthase/cobalamin synthase [Natronobacterium gregoryi SP2]ELY71571.1 cobalamin 5'-phosphate synthase [Natronobacterium gregoryi SP2]PLK19050.1 adenosylcobinamide-GDP ribazoletransferase [Natronobacterium gregoryi SP2]SFJ62887.1 cobalamin-5'-phosphate synthase [Natronobacterium gregoryi]